MLECIKVWNSRHENAKGSLKKYNAVYAKLVKKGVQFPEILYFFPNKSDPQNDSRASIKQVNNPNTVNSNPPQNSQANKNSQFKSDQDTINYIDAYKKKYQESLQQSFYYNAQELVDEDEGAPAPQPPQQTVAVPQQQTAAVSQQQTAASENKFMKSELSHPEEEEAPMMYNAQELEVDEEEQKLEDQRAAASAKDGKKVEKLTPDTKEEKQKATGTDKQAVGSATPAFALQGLVAGVKPVKAEVKETKPADQKAAANASKADPKEAKTSTDPKAATNTTKSDVKEPKPVTDSKAVTNIAKADHNENKHNNDPKLVPSVVKTDPSVVKDAEKKDAITVKVNGESVQQKRDPQANNKPGSMSQLDEKSNKDNSSKSVKEAEKAQIEREIGASQNREANTTKHTREGERANADKEIRSDYSKSKNVEDNQNMYTRESEPARQSKDNGKVYADKERRSEVMDDERAYNSNQVKTDKAGVGAVPSIGITNNKTNKFDNEGKRPSKALDDEFETLPPPKLLNDINIKLQDLSAEPEPALGKSKNRIPGSQNGLLNIIDNDSKLQSSFEVHSNDNSRQIRKVSLDDQIDLKFSPQKDHDPSQGNLDTDRSQGRKQNAQDAQKESTAANNRNANVNGDPDVNVNAYADQNRDSNKYSRDGQQITKEAAYQDQAKQRPASKNNLDVKNQEKPSTEKQNVGSNEAKGAVVDDVQVSRGRSGSTHRSDKPESIKEAVHLKKENDTLLEENRRIKEERDQLMMKLKVESEKNKNLEEHFERKRASGSVDDRNSAQTRCMLTLFYI